MKNKIPKNVAKDVLTVLLALTQLIGFVVVILGFISMDKFAELIPSGLVMFVIGMIGYFIMEPESAKSAWNHGLLNKGINDE